MIDMNLNILKLLKENKSLKEISKILEISEKQLYIRIKQLINYGYQLKPNYYSNFNIMYEVLNNIYIPQTGQLDLITSKKEEEFKCLVIYDLHIGNIQSDIKLVDSVYEYAIKNNIKIVFNCGDTLEGDYTSDKRSIAKLEDQLEFFIKKYPYDSNIINFMILGNHDHHSLFNNGLDISKKINLKRYDIVPIGIGQSNVKIKNHNILLFHKLYEGFKMNTSDDVNIILSGHGHMMKTKVYNDGLIICVPTLSYKNPNSINGTLPGFLELSLNFNRDFLTVKHLIITPSLYQINESRCNLKILHKNNGNILK